MDKVGKGLVWCAERKPRFLGCRSSFESPGMVSRSIFFLYIHIHIFPPSYYECKVCATLVRKIEEKQREGRDLTGGGGF